MMAHPRGTRGTQLSDVFVGVCWAILALQGRDGSIPPGHNGPYRDAETPVRNTAHALIAFLKGHELTGDRRFKTAAERALRYLLEGPHRSRHSFCHRTGQRKDLSNGLVGPAWTIESLICAAEHLGVPGAQSLAVELFMLHPFSADVGLWCRVEPDGTVLPEDQTFNHQLWFAAVSTPLGQVCAAAADRIRCFVDNLDRNWGMTRSGRIRHPVERYRNAPREFAKWLLRPRGQLVAVDKEIGYQAFNLYGFALLLQSELVTLDCVQQDRLVRGMRYLRSATYRRLLERSHYGFGYNPPGWEVPFALTGVAAASAEECHPWIEAQLRHSYSPATAELSERTADPILHTVRVYEAARLPDEVFRLRVSCDHMPS